jgi:AraC family transcriptional regulator
LGWGRNWLFYFSFKRQHNEWLMGYCIRPEDKVLLETLHHLLREAAGKPWTQAQLCRETGMNKIKICKGFQLLYGLSPFAYLLEQRMELAKQLLSTTGLPIKMIASRAGYQNAKSFHRAFRKHFGYTPRACR